MKYSTSKLNAIGKQIASDDIGELDRSQGVATVADWRKLHSVPLEELVHEIVSYLEQARVKPSFYSQRLKRMESIERKLKHNPTMMLGRMQDIGGARFVFDEIGDVLAARDVIENAQLNGFTKEERTYDYIQNPKNSGYRSIHFVYKYSSSNPDYDGLRVELQIRTKLQHSWAMAVETAELLSKSPLKASMGDKGWLEFFRLTSAVFAKQENMPANREFACLTEEQVCRKYGELDAQGRYLDNIAALRVSVDDTSKRSIEGGYAILLIDYSRKTVAVGHYETLDEASSIYSTTETRLNATPLDGRAVVLVSVSDINELQRAYPSYFGDVRMFIDALRSFRNQCVVKGYIKAE